MSEAKSDQIDSEAIVYKKNVKRLFFILQNADFLSLQKLSESSDFDRIIREHDDFDWSPIMCAIAGGCGKCVRFIVERLSNSSDRHGEESMRICQNDSELSSIFEILKLTCNFHVIPMLEPLFNNDLKSKSLYKSVQAHFSAEQTFKYYAEEHGRNSFDDNGTVIKSYVSYLTNFANALWDGERMTYGDGDGVNFNT